MANEVSHRHSATGETLYFTIRNVSRQMWNTAGTPNFETLTVANWGDYDVALSESPASSYFYVGTFPAVSGNMVAGWYWVDVFKRAGGSPAISDVLQASYFGYWDGTTYKWWGEDTIAVGGTVQTARDIGASVLLSAGTGTGQLDFTSGVVKSNLVQILATALTETAGGYLAAGVKKFFDVASPTSTMNLITAVTTVTNLTNLPAKLLKYLQLLFRKDAAIATDNATELTEINADGGSGAGAYDNTTDSQEGIRDTAALATELAKVPKSDSNVSWNATAAAQIQTECGDALAAYAPNTTTPPTAASIADAVWDEASTGHTDAGKAGAQLWTGVDNLLARLGAWTGSGVNTVLGAFKALLSKVASAPSDIGGTFDPAADSTEAIRDRGDAAWTTATGFSTLDAAGVRTALGMASNNLDTQLSTISTAAVLARKLKTGNIRDKSGSPGVYEILDDDDTTVIATLTLAETTPYQQVTLS